MTSCACIKKRDFDISLSHNGCSFLVLEDRSTWVKDLGYDIPESYDVYIEVPSRNTKVKVAVKLDGKTVLTSKELFGSENVTCLPDEFYCISTTSCGYDLKLNRVYLCGVETQLDELVVKYANTMTTEEREIIFDLRLKIDSIRLNAEKGNLEIAKKLFKLVKDKLKKYHCANC